MKEGRNCFVCSGRYYTWPNWLRHKRTKKHLAKIERDRQAMHDMMQGLDAALKQTMS